MSQAPKNPVTRSQKAGEADPSSGAPAAPATASAVPAPSAGEPTATTSKSKDTNPGEPAHSAKAPSKSNAPKEPKSKTAKFAVIDVDASPAQKSSLTDTIPPSLLSALGPDYIKSLGSKSVESLNKPIAVKNPLAGNGPAPELHPPSGASEECKMIGIKAIEAELAGETATANALFNLYKAMSTPKANAHLANLVNCPNPGSGGGGGREHHERKSGYKGSNFDPNYVDKRAGNSSNQDRGASNNNGTEGSNHKKGSQGAKPSVESAQ
ncbi:hypothetical protein PtA15_12A81 [Puccinia triticina]|uniref:Uncharacterized protein n=1 Tax=Puccinia triticina TaxID=208348 RepID=A0ABY7CXS2_9BASI|nr:uncharacterized protein PtA15_12A81 [Puccinia triticina]WAQ90096.1 hypothetical protein PtA15_12A81 [Puccinia triticina]